MKALLIIPKAPDKYLVVEVPIPPQVITEDVVCQISRHPYEISGVIEQWDKAQTTAPEGEKP